MDDLAKKVQKLEDEITLLRQKRIRKQDILPGNVDNRALGEVILSVETSTASASFGNGDQVLLTHTLTQNQGAKMLASVEVGVYIGSVADANQLPGGSGITESNYQVIGPWFDWADTDGNNVVLKIYVSNISAGTVTIIFKLSDRYLSNFPSAESA